jgi:hypothetical protein
LNMQKFPEMKISGGKKTARPSKNAHLISKILTIKEIQVRTETEEKLKDATDKISSPKHLSFK